MIGQLWAQFCDLIGRFFRIAGTSTETRRRRRSTLERDLELWAAGRTLPPKRRRQNPLLEKKTRKRKRPIRRAAKLAAVEQQKPKDVRAIPEPVRQFLASGQAPDSILDTTLDGGFPYGLLTRGTIERYTRDTLEVMDSAVPGRWGDRALMGLDLHSMTRGEFRFETGQGIVAVAGAQVLSWKYDLTTGLPYSGIIVILPKEDNGSARIRVLQFQMSTNLPPGVVHVGEGWPYEVHFVGWWDRTKFRDGRRMVKMSPGWYSIQWHATVNDRGEIVTCNECVRVRHSIAHGRTVPTVQVRDVEQWFAFQEQSETHVTCSQMLATAIEVTKAVEQQWCVEVRRGRTRLLFPCDYRLLRRIFSDHDGRSLLHFVKAHQRDGTTGQQNVRLHIRGNRKFTWGDLSITVMIPGRHGIPRETHLMEYHWGTWDRVIHRLWRGRTELVKKPTVDELAKAREIFPSVQRSPTDRDFERLCASMAYYRLNQKPLTGFEALRMHPGMRIEAGVKT